MEIMGKFNGLKWMQVRLHHWIILLKIKFFWPVNKIAVNYEHYLIYWGDIML